jgi:hypothetical protein
MAHQVTRDEDTMRRTRTIRLGTLNAIAMTGALSARGRVATVLLGMLFLAGCSVSAGPYAVHPDTISALRSYMGKSVKLAPFTSDKPGKSEVMCRAAAMIQTPQGVPFEKYVEDAFRTELLVAGLESPTAPVTLTGHLEQMHFQTFSKASWELQMTLASSNGRRLAIAEDYAFNWHFAGDSGCREAATAMALAVQSLVRKAVQHPEFAGLLAPGAGAPAAATPTSVNPAPTPIQPSPPTALVPPVSQPVARLPVEDLRGWAPGTWRSTGGTNTLVIDGRLRWHWDSSFGGKWSGSGSGEIRDGQLLLRGWHSTSIPMTLRLTREGGTLVGELQTSRSYPIILLRE